MQRVAERSKWINDEMTFKTNFTLAHLLHAENANHTHEDLNRSINMLENEWIIQVVLQDILSTRVKPSRSSYNSSVDGS